MNPFLKNVNRIEVIVTMSCTGKCKHCSEGDHNHFHVHIDETLVTQAIKEICKQYPIQSIMTFGGEALLFPSVVCTIHKVAMEQNILKRQLITNGFFSKDTDKIKNVAFALKESGINDLLLSVDTFHQETIPLFPVVQFAKYASEYQIPIRLNPAWLVSQEDSNPYNLKTKELLKEFASLNIPVGNGNVIFPQGNALQNFAEYFDKNIKVVSPYDEDPFDLHTIDFSHNGDVLHGNIYKEPMQSILDTYRP